MVARYRLPRSRRKRCPNGRVMTYANHTPGAASSSKAGRNERTFGQEYRIYRMEDQLGPTVLGRTKLIAELEARYSKEPGGVPSQGPQKEHIMNIYFGLVGSGAPADAGKFADPPSPSCYRLFPGTRIKVSQTLRPDLFARRGRDTRGRFAKGSSGNPHGARRRLSDLIDRRPHLLRPLAAQPSPPPAASTRRSVSGSTSRRCGRPRMPADAEHRSGGPCVR
jgi:hypothetical protein